MVVRPRWIEQTLKWLWPGVEPSSAAFLLAARLAEWGVADQWLACIGPAIRVSVVGVVGVKELAQSVFKFFGGAKFSPLEKTSSKNAKPEFHLVQP